MDFFTDEKKKKKKERRVYWDEFVLCMHGMIQQTSPTGGCKTIAALPFSRPGEGIRISPTELLSICQIWIHFAAASFRRQVTGWSLVLHSPHIQFTSVECQLAMIQSVCSSNRSLKQFKIQFELQVKSSGIKCVNSYRNAIQYTVRLRYAFRRCPTDPIRLLPMSR